MPSLQHHTCVRTRTCERLFTCAVLLGFSLVSHAGDRSEARSLARDANEAVHSDAVKACSTGASVARVTSATILGESVEIEAVLSAGQPRRYHFVLGSHEAPNYPPGSWHCIVVKQKRTEDRKRAR